MYGCCCFFDGNARESPERIYPRSFWNVRSRSDVESAKTSRLYMRDTSYPLHYLLVAFLYPGTRPALLWRSAWSPLGSDYHHLLFKTLFVPFQPNHVHSEEARLEESSPGNLPQSVPLQWRDNSRKRGNEQSRSRWFPASVWDNPSTGCPRRKLKSTWNFWKRQDIGS